MLNRFQVSNFQAIIFDMDGVLVDSEYWWPKVKGNFYTSIATKWKKKYEAQLLGQSLADIYKWLAKDFGATIAFKEFVKKYNEFAESVYKKHSRLFPNVLNVLKYLKELKQLKTALASSSSHAWINMVIERFDLEHFFTKIISAEDVGAHGKPAPDIYLYTGEQLNIKPKKCAVIEDSKNGVLSAKAASMFAIGYRTPHNEKQDLSAADIIINNLKELI